MDPGEKMKNVGRLDQQVRYAVGALLLAYAGIAFFVDLPLMVGSAVIINAAPRIAAVVNAVLGVALIATAQLRFCGLYRLIGVNTCPIDERK